MIALEQIGQIVTHRFTDVSKMVGLGSNAQREVKDYLLSRFACYLIAWYLYLLPVFIGPEARKLKRPSLGVNHLSTPR